MTQVLTQHSTTAARGPRGRAGARCAVITLGVLLGSASAPAFGAPPTTWENRVATSPWEVALVLVFIPLAIIIAITVLTYLPTLLRRRGGSAEPAVVFAEHSEWFGGPREGLESLTQGSTPAAGRTGSTVVSADPGTGGASARW